jgi:hypothetical protein
VHTYAKLILAQSQTMLQKLLDVAARNNKLTKKIVELDGDDFTFWHKPMTIDEYQQAKAKSRNPEDALEAAIRLFVNKALDEAGRNQYQVDAIPVLQKALPMEMASKLIGAMQSDETEEEEEMDYKSPEGSVQTGKPTNK